jgi:uncharacterized repeat protein (TIGR03803 family)
MAAAAVGARSSLTHKGSVWVFNPLYSFQGGNDGANPIARVVFGPNGVLYGTTFQGGSAFCDGGGCGTVFNLKPPVTACKTALCPWTETVLYSFTGGSDGSTPYYGDLVFDQAGNVYGTTRWGGTGGDRCLVYGCGTVFKLTHSQGTWTESVLYSFTYYQNDGKNPDGGVILDKAGDLYGTTETDSLDFAGTVFELTPSGSDWVENTLHVLNGGGDGKAPEGGLIFDQSGNLYATASSAGSGGGGTVYQLTPSGGNWTFTVLYSFPGRADCGPYGSLVMDSTGNLHGTTVCGGAYGYGSVFKLTPSDGGWMYTPLHDFTGGSDGRGPSSVILDTNGDLYGTASAGGAYGYGVAWQITP